MYKTLLKICEKQSVQGEVVGISAGELAKLLNMKRPNVVRELTKLISKELIAKKEGRPVLYYTVDKGEKDLNAQTTVLLEAQNDFFDNLTGKDSSLKHQISLAKAAIVYPPNGLHTLIVGETGVGKSFFAKCMFKYALEIKRVKDENRFAVFNCADYANNPQLLVSHLFGVKKGAYTGASEDKEGIIEKSRDGVLFLDEIHRLPPEGQEMLFTLIDYGYYVPLGSVKEVPITVMIICATTENTDSTLLRTFKRRIPVTISLPPLRERNLEERLQLIKNFLEEESNRIHKGIEIDSQALTALLNYECLNNIGQLKSDIQIACAKAFLRSMMKQEDVYIRTEDFSEEVKKGLLAAKKVKAEDYLNLNIHSSLTNGNDTNEDDKYDLSNNIYDFIEDRSKYLHSSGLDSNAITDKISEEIETYISRYLSNLEPRDQEDDIKLIINNELYDFLKAFMHLAAFKLERKLSKNTFMGLLIHLDTFFIRAKEGKLIENPKLNSIRRQYPKEFKVAMLLAEKVEEKYNIDVPMDEIGFITMFFAADIQDKQGRVAVIVAMHGSSTATSMAEVANQLLNTKHAKAFDLPLSMKPEEGLDNIKEMVKKYDEGRGALILVDMGSLKFFGQVIEETTGIRTMAIDMVSTPMVIEATRKALINQNLEEIAESVDLESRYLGKFSEDAGVKKDKVIITACSTGHGTAEKLKELIYKKYPQDEYKVINLSIKDKEKFIDAVNGIKKTSNVISIISAFKVEIPGIEYYPLDEFLKHYAPTPKENRELFKNMEIVFKEHLEIPQGKEILKEFYTILQSIAYRHGLHFDIEKTNGILMHFGCLTERIINNAETPKCENLNAILSRHFELYEYLSSRLKNIEDSILIKYSDDDICNLIEILVSE
ncbi:sigma-54-dependent transcriptional regulator [Clostridium polynesiense]|uniref:sigma-54-dependent transcriptional regulator n=1 Tax=Clostridium polynesiense TaxID=1325933 RepID=UPI000590510C|nr:sigma-54-dependent transcriptional regulator [Clostridium polynesiense]